jgi:hypothetical protein
MTRMKTLSAGSMIVANMRGTRIGVRGATSR